MDSNLIEIAAVDGVDAIFFGPADLSATMGYPGEMEHPEVMKTITSAIKTLQTLNMPTGIMALSKEPADQYIDLGVNFIAVAVDSVSMVQSLTHMRSEF